MPITNVTSAFALRNAGYGGVISEDVMEEIYQISPIDVPLQNIAGVEPCHHPRKEWVINQLNAVNLANARFDGEDLSSAASVGTTGSRMGNWCQISTTVLAVSDRAQDTDQFGRSDELVYQLMNRQLDLKRDMEAILTWDQASVAQVDATTAAKLGAIGSWFNLTATATVPANCQFVSTGGTPASTGFNLTTGVTTTPTYGTTTGALTETAIRAGMQQAYLNGGDPKYLMARPEVIARLSQWMFNASARIATLQTNANPVDIKRVPGKKDDIHQGLTAIGSVNVMVTDFGTVTFLPNRFQPLNGATNTNGAAVYLLDPDYLAIAYLHKPRVDQLARTGLSDNRVVSVDYTLVNKNPFAHAAIFGINPATAVAA